MKTIVLDEPSKLIIENKIRLRVKSQRYLNIKFKIQTKTGKQGSVNDHFPNVHIDRKLSKILPQNTETARKRFL